MDRYVVEIAVDVEELRRACGEGGDARDLAELLEREFEWLRNSGIEFREMLSERTDRTNGILVIDGVDLELLEDQRQRLNRALFDADGTEPVPSRLELDARQVDALVGVLNMLDAWSGERWEGHAGSLDFAAGGARRGTS